MIELSSPLIVDTTIEVGRNVVSKLIFGLLSILAKFNEMDVGWLDENYYEPSGEMDGKWSESGEHEIHRAK